MEASLCLSRIIDLTIPVEVGKGDLFGLQPPEYVSLLPPDAPCKADRICFCAHSAGTHTECAAHITKQGDFTLVFAQQRPIMHCLVVRVEAVQLGETNETYCGSVPAPAPNELVVSKLMLDREMSKYASMANDNCVFIHVDNAEEHGWVFFTDQAMDYLVEQFNTYTLLVNLCSVDRERCGHAMPAHSRFFLPTRNSNAIQRQATITENVKSSSDLVSGWYWLNLQLGPFLGTDAVPSRVLLFSSLVDSPQ